jgi:microcystin-dependent protein
MKKAIAVATVLGVIVVAAMTGHSAGTQNDPPAEEAKTLSGLSQVPVGTIIAYAGNSIPRGWLLCDGSKKDKQRFLNLFKAIQYTYGGSGGTFQVPDLQGRVAIGDGQGANLSSRKLGQRDGKEIVALSVEQIPAHAHVIVAHRDGAGFGGVDEGGGQERVKTEKAGGGQPHENMPPFLVIRYLIKY